MEQIQSFISGPIGTLIISLLAALVILIVGYIVARIIASIVRRILKRISLDNRLADSLSDPDETREFEIEDVIGKITFWVIMLFVIVAALDRLNLDAISQPLALFLNSLTTVYLPRLLGAGALLFVAWLIAAALRILVRKVGKLLKFDERLSKHTALEEGEQVSITEPLATATYWLVFLLFIPAILEALGIRALALPLTGVLNDLFGYIPAILSATVVALVGWFLAKIVRNVITNLLKAIGTDKFGLRAGMPEDRSLSEILGTVIYVTILILVIIQALDQLNINAISDPLNNMLLIIVDAIPAILGAIVILLLAYFLGKIIAGLVKTLLTAVGFDVLPEKLGLKWSATRTPSEWIGWLTLIVIMIFAATAAVELLGSAFLVSAMDIFITLLWNVFLAAVIFAFGLYFANLVYKIIYETGTDNALFMARMAKVLVIIFAAAIALGQLGIAKEIINLAFGISLGAIALAFALAFGLGVGLGDRDIAGREVDDLITKWRTPPAEISEDATVDTD
ncbi:MAG: mechanosensitive ion channel [Chloroflexi bacterium]|jgi:hypothetical protein|nr:mechanosensitive ion channel [Chloroflexota bacterium]